MRRASKIDDNQNAIVNSIRSYGFSVSITSAVGQGFSDLVVAYGGKQRGRTWLVEVKDGAKSPSKRRLTADQVKFHDKWQAPIQIIETVEQAKLWAGAMKILVDGCLK